MTFGDDWGWGASREDVSRQMFDTYVEAGGNLHRHGQRLHKRYLERKARRRIYVRRPRRDRFVIATKYTANMRPGDPNAGGNHRKKPRAVGGGEPASASGTNYIDLLWLHMPGTS